MTATVLIDATKNSTCPVCGKPDWCKMSEDKNLVLCRREKRNARFEKIDKNSVPYYIHVTEKFSLSRTFKQKRALFCGRPPEIGRLTAVYPAFLDLLDLSETHLDHLIARGFSRQQVEFAGYKSLKLPGRTLVTKNLAAIYSEDYLLSVPGFYRHTKCKSLTFGGPTGIVIPIRNLKKQIVALKVRRNLATTPKYVYFSSKAYGGPGPGAPVHVPIFGSIKTKLLRITEGELKADFATLRTGVLTLSIPGVQAWRKAQPIINAINPRVVRIAFDSDIFTNKYVAHSLSNLYRALKESGTKVEVETWN